MYRKLFIVAILVTGNLTMGISTPGFAQTATPEPVFRAPFTMKLRVDAEHYYEQEFGKVPYVFQGDVYLFNDESFGVTLTTKDDQVVGVVYQPDAAKADLWFKFEQQKSADGLMTLLTTKNNTSHRIYLDALMTVPRKKSAIPTNLLPIEAKLISFESWPHPILQLVLRNLRFSKDSASAK